MDCFNCSFVDNMNRIEQELAQGKKLVGDMFEAQKAFGECAYPSNLLYDIWHEIEKQVKEWSGK